MSCNKILTYVYSSHCVEYLEELISSLRSTFSVKVGLDDMFYHGVFCNAETYSNFKGYANCHEDVPGILSSPYQSAASKLDYVKGVIGGVLRGEVDKPGWMTYVEETEAFNGFEDAPSTFLYLLAKDERYVGLGEALTNFLYSPNLMMTLRSDWGDVGLGTGARHPRG